MKLCLNMIVKNEAARIERMLESVSPYIDSAVIVDTGSTDDTKQKIKKFFSPRNNALIVDEPFNDWSQARNAALRWARESGYKADYFLLADADMELRVVDKERFLAHRDGPSYDMYQVSGSTHYQNRRLVKATEAGGYVGVTHEYLDIPPGGLIDEDVAYFYDHADGANRPSKWKRDIKLLLGGLKKEPNNERYFFYLAQSYRDAGKPKEAAKWFKRRVEAGGWPEEQWQAQVNYAKCLLDLKDEAGYIKETLVAYNMRPSRAEPMRDLANHYRLKNMHAPALACAEACLHLPLSKDALFVDDYTYKAGLKQEASICAYYVPGKRRSGYKITSDLAMLPGPYAGPREEARTNMFYYLEPLSEFCPSFKWKPIPFTPPDGWQAMNPSVTRVGGHLVYNIRCVNYKINEHGQYCSRNPQGEWVTGEGAYWVNNPIVTRNFLQYDGQEAKEVYAPPGLPCEWPLVLGFEDMRIFFWQGDIWSSSTVRQLHADGNCEMVLTRLEPALVLTRSEPAWPDAYQHAYMKRMLRLPRQTEKNWAPIPYGNELRFMWRPLELVDTDGNTTSKRDPGVAVDNISGSSQVIPYKSGWLAITHEARQLPGKPTRYYTHRFVFYDYKFTTAKFSLPFYFNDKCIEFCAGLCPHPDKDALVISYGYKDEEARTATVNTDEVENFLWS